MSEQDTNIEMKDPDERENQKEMKRDEAYRWERQMKALEMEAEHDVDNDSVDPLEDPPENEDLENDSAPEEEDLENDSADPPESHDTSVVISLPSGIESDGFGPGRSRSVRPPPSARLHDEYAMKVWTILKECYDEIRFKEPHRQVKENEQDIKRKWDDVRRLERQIKALKKDISSKQAIVDKKKLMQGQWKERLDKVLALMEEVENEDYQHYEVMKGYQAERRNLQRKGNADQSQELKWSLLNRTINHQKKMDQRTVDFRDFLTTSVSNARTAVREAMAM